MLEQEACARAHALLGRMAKDPDELAAEASAFANIGAPGLVTFVNEKADASSAASETKSSW